jgi:hypothetical protein
MARRKVNIRITRDLVLFTFGLAGIAYETVVVHVDRPSLLFVFGACIGLPAFLHADEKKAIPTDAGPPAKPEPYESPPAEIVVTTKKPAPRKRAPVKKAAAKKQPVKKQPPKKKPAPRRTRTEE